MSTYTLIAGVTGLIEPPETGIASHTLFNDDHMKIVLFHFAAGHVMAEHAAPTPVTLHFVAGEATVTLGEETREVEGDAMIHMQPRLTHRIAATTQVTMLLYMLKAARPA